MAAARPDFGNLRLGISISATNAEQAAAEAAWATKAGFQRVQLNVWSGALTDEQVEAICAPVTGTGLRIVALGCYLNPLDPANQAYMGASVDLMRSLAANHRAHGARTFVTWSGGHHDRFAGSDPPFRHWYQWEQLARLAKLVICPRLGFSPNQDFIAELRKKGTDIIFLNEVTAVSYTHLTLPTIYSV